MLALIAPVIVFGLVIFVHELGHFMAAKLMGVYAPRFSIGFGPALFRRRRGETEYVLALLPLGGYVRMASRHDAEAAMLEGGNEEGGALSPGDKGYDPDALQPFGPHPVPEDRWFESKGLLPRLFIMVAGVVMNIVLAYTVFLVLNLHYGNRVVASRVVGEVQAPAGASALSQIQPGDTIVAVNGRGVASWNDVLDRIEGSTGPAVTIRTNRGEVRVPVGGAGAPTPELVAQGLNVFMPSVIGEVLSGSPADRAGLRAGDSVVAIGQRPITQWSELLARVSASPGVALPFEVVRTGKRVTMTIRPESTAVQDASTRASRTVGRIGAVNASISTRQPMTAAQSVSAAGRQTLETAKTIAVTVKRLVTREMSVRQLGGPIAITQASVAAARSGLDSMFYLIALLSINVAILNMLPIPILDGGQILINIAEAAKGSPFSMRTRDYIMRFGLVAILLIFALSTFNDVKPWIVRLFS
ncbi:MAG TPA: RIP metalloprotease RseP [Gemmatimonadaceae bacterium]|jgi:regulator of sigma E protease|nr:RIP metalloprotease RseP [Gemmatimonadaceae bacterium]